jgi:hypothetical protein
MPCWGVKKDLLKNLSRIKNKCIYLKIVTNAARTITNTINIAPILTIH